MQVAINTLNESYFRVTVEIVQESSQVLPTSQIREGLHRWLQTLDPELVSRQRQSTEYDEHPQWRWERDGWILLFFAIPRPLEDWGKPGETWFYQLSAARREEAQNALQKALNEKAKRYGKLSLPYVIAVDVLAMDSFGTDMEEVLFGKEVFLFDRQSEELTMTRSPFLPNRTSDENGLWVARRGARNRQVSGVLLVEELMPWSVARKTPVLWCNPWAEKPLDQSIWQGPMMIPDMTTQHMQLREGKKAYEIFGLPPNWPNDLSVSF